MHKIFIQAGQFKKTRPDDSSGRGRFRHKTYQVGRHLLENRPVCIIRSMVYLFFNNEFLILRRQQWFDMLLQQFQPYIRVAEFLFKKHGPVFNPAQIHHVVNDINNMLGRFPDGLQALPYQFIVADIFLRNIRHTDYCIKGILHFFANA